MTPGWALVLMVAAAPGPSLRVAMVDGPGVAARGRDAARELLAADHGVALELVSAEQLRAGVLERMDVVIFMGGDGARQGAALGAEGRDQVRAFVRAGGGYLGVCAGAYLAMQGPDRFHKLRLVAARNLSGPRWKRGVGPARLAASGRKRRLGLHFAQLMRSSHTWEQFRQMDSTVVGIYRRQDLDADQE